MSYYLIKQLAAIAEHPGAHAHHGDRGARRRAPGGADPVRQGRAGRRRRCPPGTCSCSSAPSRAPTGSTGRSPATSAASSTPAPICSSAASGRRAGIATAIRSIWRRACPGIFVAGDVRANSVKRVASAVGEGAMAVTLVHRYLEVAMSRQLTASGAEDPVPVRGARRRPARLAVAQRHRPRVPGRQHGVRRGRPGRGLLRAALRCARRCRVRSRAPRWRPAAPTSAARTWVPPRRT